MNYYNLEAEQAVLGAVLLNRDIIYETTLTPEDFYHESHQKIFAAMLEVRDQEKNIDIVTLSYQLRDNLQDVGGTKYLLDMCNAVPTTADTANYERIVKDRYLMRLSMTKLKEIYSGEMDDPQEIANELTDLIEAITDQSKTVDAWKHIKDGLLQHADVISDKKESGIPTGAATAGIDLDKITGRWKSQTLNIVAARPSMGKTAYLLNNAVRNASEGLTVAIFSLEMDELQLYDRMIAAECHIDGKRIQDGALRDDEWETYTLGLSRLAGLDIWIDDRPGLSIHEIRTAVRKLKKKRPNLIVYIDYLQLIKGGKKFENRSRNDEVGYISSSLKQMARENECPVVALAQLSRSVEQRQDKRPMMSDLRESGNIEQDADIIMFLYRDDYYNQETEKKNIIEMIVSKNRNGATGVAEMVNLKQYGKFAHYERAYV
ncbi:replicative DNA helicase [Paenibacillus massiliensis]|uniref:replicative DNA helicase n=1 Tax=Paenibacillus massiliensis TaxID=225917 RepID=UPI0003FBD197|nr:replicative DNA helicase [Paenibacillus massiliensis]